MLGVGVDMDMGVYVCCLSSHFKDTVAGRVGCRGKYVSASGGRSRCGCWDV